MTPRRAASVATAATASLILLAGCTKGTVQDKRQRPGRLMGTAYELCIGESKANCTWTKLSGKFDDLDYKQCKIGDAYPDCIGILGKHS